MMSALQLLSFGTLVVFLLRFAQILWNRRKLYREAAKVHGPKGPPILGNAIDYTGSATDIYTSVMKLFNNYPELAAVWYGPNLVWAVSKPEYLETVMNHPGALEKMYLYKFAIPLMGFGLFTADVPTWKRHRKLILPAFNQKILDSFVDVFSEQFDILTEQLKKYVNGPEFDIFPELSKCTLDIVCRTAMNITDEAQTTDSNMHKGLDRVMEITIVRMFNVWYHFDWVFNLTQLNREMWKIIRKFHNFTDSVIQKKRQEYENNNEAPVLDGLAKKRKVFLDLLMETTKLTDTEIRDEVNTFMVGGSDTTASSSGFLFIILGIFQDVQDRVYEEVMEILGSDRPIDPHDLPLLKYTERVIKEAQRFFPVGAFIVRDITEDIPLSSGVTLPAGSSAILGIMHAHRNPDYWPEPMKFDPDRFLPENSSKRHPFAYLPFSGGPRNCPGSKYAMMAMKSLLVTMVRKYRIATSYKSIEDVALKTNVMIRPIHGYKVALTPR